LDEDDDDFQYFNGAGYVAGAHGGGHHGPGGARGGHPGGHGRGHFVDDGGYINISL